MLNLNYNYMKNVAINGFGRIGRAYLKLVLSDKVVEENLNIVAINDLGDLDNLIYLLKYDTVYRRDIFKSISSRVVSDNEKYLVIEFIDNSKKEIRYISEKDTSKFIQNKI